MKKMKYLFMTLAIVGIFALSIQSNIYAAEERVIPIEPQFNSGSVQFNCDFNAVSVVGGAPRLATGTLVTIDNGSKVRNVIVQFSTEVVVTAGSIMSIHYSIDGAPSVVVGPEFLASNNTFFETKTHMGVISLPAGVHTIEPFIDLTGPATATGTVFFRCLTAEGRTK